MIENTISSLALAKEINIFRYQEGRKELKHNDLLKIIRDEFSGDEGNLSLISYKDTMNRAKPMYMLTYSQAKQVLVRESKFVRRAVIAYIEKLENNFRLPGNYLEALEALVASEKEKMKLQQKAQRLELTSKENQQKAVFADSVRASKGSCLVSELAKIISQNGVPMGQNRLFTWLRVNGYICIKGDYYNQPTQRSMEMGLFEVKKTSVIKADGSIIVNSTTKVTGKGQIYIINKILNKYGA